MSIEVLKYAARQICRHFEMLNDKNYTNARVESFINWHKSVTKRIAEGELTTKPENISYSASVEPFKVKEVLPKNHRFYFYEDWAYRPFKMDYRIAVERIRAEQILPGANRSKFFKVDIITDTIIKPAYSDSKAQKLYRKACKLLKPYTANIIIVNNRTSYEDILMQLIIMALRERFIELDKEAVRFLQSYIINRKVWIKKPDKEFIRDLLYADYASPAYNALFRISRNYRRPYRANTFKHYLRKFIEGMGKEKKRRDINIIPRDYEAVQFDQRYQDNKSDEELQEESLFQESFEEKQAAYETDLQNRPVEYRNEFQVFYKDGKEIGLGVDRAAKEIGISRDRIYRFIKKGIIKPFKVDGTYCLDEKAQQKLSVIVRKKEAYKNRLDEIEDTGVKRDSARKRIRRGNLKSSYI